MLHALAVDGFDAEGRDRFDRAIARADGVTDEDEQTAAASLARELF